MQHAVGSPLPPPHQPGQGPAAGWSPAAHQPGPSSTARPGAPRAPPPCPRRPLHRATPRRPRSPAPPPAPHHSPAPDTTGHVPLPPGGPVAMPSAPPATTVHPGRHQHDPRRAADRPRGCRQDERRQVLGGPPPGPHRTHQPRRRTRMGPLGLRRPAVGLERRTRRRSTAWPAAPAASPPATSWPTASPASSTTPSSPTARSSASAAGSATWAPACSPSSSSPAWRSSWNATPSAPATAASPTRRWPASTAVWRAGTARACRSSTTPSWTSPRRRGSWTTYWPRSIASPPNW